MLRTLPFPLIEGLDPLEWERALHLIDFLENRSGAEVAPVIKEDEFIGFALHSGGQMLSAVEHFKGDSFPESIDSLSRLFFQTFGKTVGET
tara:strand:+ start:666 stop:938 length:273 start_codon:yes stop_codon:yes gene_type:complete